MPFTRAYSKSKFSFLLLSMSMGLLILLFFIQGIMAWNPIRQLLKNTFKNWAQRWTCTIKSWASKSTLLVMCVHRISYPIQRSYLLPFTCRRSLSQTFSTCLMVTSSKRPVSNGNLRGPMSQGDVLYFGLALISFIDVIFPYRWWKDISSRPAWIAVKDGVSGSSV